MKKILKTMASVLLIAAFAATAVSCSKDDEDINILGSDVYVAGRDGSVAKVWKNGEALPLTDGTGTSYSEASSVFVK